MARRVITPTLFDDEFFGALPDRAALIWIVLFGVIADDHGRLVDNPMLIRARSFPYRDVPVSDVVDAVESFVAAGKLVRYEADTGVPQPIALLGHVPMKNPCSKPFRLVRSRETHRYTSRRKVLALIIDLQCVLKGKG